MRGEKRKPELIRQLGADYQSSKVAAGAFERQVHIWDLIDQDEINTFPTVLDFGGDRLAISPDGSRCLVGSFREGVALYDADSGYELWKRTDLLEIQVVKFSRFFGGNALVFLDKNACHVLSLATGEEIEVIPNVSNIFEDQHKYIMICDSGKALNLIELSGLTRRTIAALPQSSFKVLDAILADGLAVISEVGGSLKAFSSETGIMRWSYNLGSDRHVLKLGFFSASKIFLGLAWDYQNGGDPSLLMFRSDGRNERERKLVGCSPEVVFALEGSVLVTCEGQLLDIQNGREIARLGLSD